MNLDELAYLYAVEDEDRAEDEENRIRRVYQYKDPFTELTQEEFRSTYRLTKDLARDLVIRLTPFMTPAIRRTSLDISRKILTALRFFASGSYQRDVGHNVNNAVSQASVSRCITEVAAAINNPAIFNEFVYFPRNVNEMRQLRREHNFPGVIGCIDCTHDAIFPPITDDPVYPEAMYLNRKGYHSINVQLICDSSLRILNVNARYPGSTHDEFIWNNSNVLPVMKALHDGGQKSFSLLGNSGYPLRSWLLTPFADAMPNSPEGNYNAPHMRTRSLIERCNGVLKMRFRCLLKHRVLHYHPEKASQIINSCVVLHNICVANNLQLNDEVDNEDFGIYDGAMLHGPQRVPNRINPELAAGRAFRQQLATHFNFL